MRQRDLTSALLLALAVAVPSAAFSAEPKIGAATATKNQVEGVIEGKTQPIAAGHDVFSNETVRTGGTGLADLQFLDNTGLNVGPLSEIRLDKFVYDPTGSGGAV